MVAVKHLPPNSVFELPSLQILMHALPRVLVPFSCSGAIAVTIFDHHASRIHSGDQLDVCESVQHVPVVEVLFWMSQIASRQLLVRKLGVPIVEMARDDNGLEA